MLPGLSNDCLNPVQARTLLICPKTVVFQAFFRFNKYYWTQSTNTIPNRTIPNWSF